MTAFLERGSRICLVKAGAVISSLVGVDWYDMASLELDKVITDFCSLFGVKIGKLSFFLGKIPTTQINGKNEVQGLRNLISHVSGPNNPEFEIIQDQWVEYVLIYMGNLDNSSRTQVLKDINDYMIDKVYFIGNQLGPIDVLIYYLLYNLVLNLTFQEKEKFLNFSRWFNNVQQNDNTRLGRLVIPFSKSQLYL